MFKVSPSLFTCFIVDIWIFENVRGLGLQAEAWGLELETGAGARGEPSGKRPPHGTPGACPFSDCERRSDRSCREGSQEEYFWSVLGDFRAHFGASSLSRASLGHPGPSPGGPKRGLEDASWSDLLFWAPSMLQTIVFTVRE